MSATTERVAVSRHWHWKWWLYIVHRWIGIVTCLLFAIWFVSGLVMIYVPFPELSRSEQLAHLPPIDWRQVRATPAMEGVESAALEMAGDRAVWRVRPWGGAARTLWATDATPIGKTDAVEARRIAARFGGVSVVDVAPIIRDQWTVAGGFDRHRPLWKARLAGPGGHVLYVSSQTGAVVLDTAAHERFWNWLGSIPHWIYPTVLRQDNAVWRQVVMWVSGPCIVGAVAGMWIGVLRTRLGRRRFKGGRVHPYRGWFAWHYWAGMIGGLFLVAWIFSGWLSVDPFRLFASPGIGDAERIAYAGSARMPTIDFASLGLRNQDARRITLYRAAGEPLVMVERRDATRAVFAASTLAPLGLERATMIAAAAKLAPRAPIVAVETLTEPDAYWYAVGERPILPVLRVRFGDPAATWAHIDPASGRLIGDMDRRRRIYRWAFDLLHKWDVNALTLHRPVWDITLWLLSLAGLVTSVTGVWIGWKRLRRNR